MLDIKKQTKEKKMFLDTMVLDEAQNTYEIKGTTTQLIHLWCGTCGVPTGSIGCSCYRVPKFTSRIIKLALNDYDETATDYKTETGYVITPNNEPAKAQPQMPTPKELDATPIHNSEPEQNQPHDDFLTWQGMNPREEKRAGARMLDSASAITDRFHPTLMMELKTPYDIAQAMFYNPTMKICKTCGYQQHISTKKCHYC